MSNQDRQALNHQKVNGEIPSLLLTSLEWRLIGPFRGGRVVAVAGDPVHPQLFYFGSTGGGVWKTTDGGQCWENISDGFFKRASVGAIAVAPSDSNVIYVGMGETTIRGNVSHGDGVYRSTDGGRTWTHLGLEDTRHIGKIRIHPHNPELVYVAALGHAHGPNSERGIFRSHNGGQSWERILFLNEDVGAHDIAMDPHNPRVLYAALWRARRLPHMLNSGGDGCGLYTSSDGGDSWTDISRNKGLPTGTLGKIDVTVSGAQKDRIWATVEAEVGTELLTPANDLTQLSHNAIELIRRLFGRTGPGGKLLGDLIGQTDGGRDLFIAFILVVNRFVQVPGYIHHCLDILQEHLGIGMGMLG